MGYNRNHLIFCGCVIKFLKCFGLNFWGLVTSDMSPTFSFFNFCYCSGHKILYPFVFFFHFLSCFLCHLPSPVSYSSTPHRNLLGFSSLIPFLHNSRNGHHRTVGVIQTPLVCPFCLLQIVIQPHTRIRPFDQVNFNDTTFPDSSTFIFSYIVSSKFVKQQNLENKEGTTDVLSQDTLSENSSSGRPFHSDTGVGSYVYSPVVFSRPTHCFTGRSFFHLTLLWAPGVTGPPCGLVGTLFPLSRLGPKISFYGRSPTVVSLGVDLCTPVQILPQ